VQIVLILMDVMLVLRLIPVVFVLLGMKAITVEDVIHAVPALILNSTVTLVSLALVDNTQMQHQALVRLVPVIVQLAHLRLNAQVVILDMVICPARALSVAEELTHWVEPTLVKHAVPENGQVQETTAVNIVSIHLDVKPVYPHLLVPLVRLDMKVMAMEVAHNALKEHIRQLMVNVRPALLVNGHFLEVAFVDVTLTNLIITKF